MKAHERQAESFSKLAKEIGCDIKWYQAQTGTIYIEITEENFKTEEIVQAKYRFADHADAYATADYSCDPAEGTLSGAKKHLMDLVGFEKSTLNKMRKQKRDAQKVADNSIDNYFPDRELEDGRFVFVRKSDGKKFIADWDTKNHVLLNIQPTE